MTITMRVSSRFFSLDVIIKRDHYSKHLFQLAVAMHVILPWLSKNDPPVRTYLLYRRRFANTDGCERSVCQLILSIWRTSLAGCCNQQLKWKLKGRLLRSIIDQQSTCYKKGWESYWSYCHIIWIFIMVQIPNE